ncbi:hypothetical protein RN001_008961 [Aquatica leii]|uniref:DNA repair protein complementing XP-G cells n=1 Tax=Aquatica leii TaxID=1421715 RepID=A0AAN7SRK2_9COLE|nr:hypothetical protein RN001_008961 [Aquatica leii]
MGVTGLWRLIEPSGTLVPLQSLDNKVLAVDVSIWLHQAIKGFQNAQGGTIPNAHLLGIYHRICKLLFYGIKPVVIFDGGVPHLKQQTIFQRSSKRTKALSDAETIHNKLVSALLKHTAISKILSEESRASLTIKPVKEQTEDIYQLPPTKLDSSRSSEEDESTSIDSSPTKQWNLDTIDEKSARFKALPVDVRHDILTDLKETRKQSSWGRLHELPKQSDDFSVFQMKRLLKRYSIQASLEEVEKEMGGRSLSLAEIESLLKDQGVAVNDDSVGKRIASDESKRYLLIKDLKKAIDEAKERPEVIDIINKKKEETDAKVEDEAETLVPEAVENKSTPKCDLEFENDLKLAIELSLQDVPSTSKQANVVIRENLHEVSYLQDSVKEILHDSSESDEEFGIDKNINKVLASAKNYMVEYSGLTPSEIAKIMGGKAKSSFETQTSTKTITKSSVPEQPHQTEEFIKESRIETVSSTNLTTSSPTNKNQIEALRQLENSNEVLNKETTHDDVEDVIEFHERNVTEDGGESDSSCDFVEVEENISQSEEKTLNALEIVVQPEHAPEDDLFIDIFSKQSEPVKDVTKPMAEKLNLKNIRDVINLEKDVEEVIDEKSEPTNNGKIDKIIEAKIDENVSSPMSREQLQEIQQNIQLENIELVKEQLSKERMANSLSEQIIQDTQDLLRLFGIPYIIAPMEAEAQCAFLEIIDLTDGTITDDSDIWLFGGKTVYKNFFNQQKHVLEFRAEKIQEHYKLSREQMILLALLVGSDYTLGLQGVGPVTALEILGAFPSALKQIESTFNYQQLISGLIDFRKWLNGERTFRFGRQGLRSKLKNVSINDSFPNLDVVRAYLEPIIDSSKEPFSWRKPNIDGLIDYAKRKFGWSQSKSEGILKPVLKTADPEVQKSIKHYFKTKHKIQGVDVENKMSKRVKKAVETIEHGVDNTSEEDKSVTTNNVLRKQSKKKNEERNCGLSSDEDVKVLEETRKQSKTKLNKIQKEVVSELAGVKKVPTIASLHKKEVIPQRQRDKSDALRNKIKAIEAFRKSKKGPGKTREGAPLQEDIVDTLRCQRQDYINKNFYNSPISSSATYDSTPNFTSRFSLATRENSRLTPHSEIEQSVQGQILKHLVILREQNEQILLTLQKFSKERSQHITTSVPKFPVSLPLSDLENLKEFENYLLNEQNLSATSAYLSSLDGNTIASRTNRILRQLLEDRLASTYNFFGSRNKEAFNKLQLTRLIIVYISIYYAVVH